MRGQHAQWATASRMRTHNAWHLAMFDAEAGNLTSALSVLDTWLLPASAESPLDACDATALLWRLADAAEDDGRRWRMLSDAFERNITAGFWPYVDLHAAVAYWKAGNAMRAHGLQRDIERCAQGRDYAALRARHITRPGLRAIGAWAAGRHSEAVDLLKGMQPLLGEIGGSRVQLDVFRTIENDETASKQAAPRAKVQTRDEGQCARRRIDRASADAGFPEAWQAA
jgi:hypothetical protein